VLVAWGWVPRGAGLVVVKLRVWLGGERCLFTLIYGMVGLICGRLHAQPPQAA
jgi:hypothetical protein